MRITKLLLAIAVATFAALLIVPPEAAVAQRHHWTRQPAQIPTHQWGYRAPIHMNTWRFARITPAPVGEFGPPIHWLDLPTADELRLKLGVLGLSEEQMESVDRLWNNYEYLEFAHRQRRQSEIYRVRLDIARAQRFNKPVQEMQLRRHLDELVAGELVGWSRFARALRNILTWHQERMLYAIEYPADARARFKVLRTNPEELDVNYQQMQKARQLNQEYEEMRQERQEYEARELQPYQERIERLQQSPKADDTLLSAAQRSLELRHRQLQAEHLLRERMYADRLNATLTAEQTQQMVAMAEGSQQQEQAPSVQWYTDLPSEQSTYAFEE